MINREIYEKSIYNIRLRVVYYARVSTDNIEQSTSIINQVNYFKNYINNIESWLLVGEYIDEGISGKNIYNRINFKRMIRDGIRGKYDLILTKSVSRFARNTIDSIKYTNILKNKGIYVYFINDNINTFNSDSEFRLTLMASIAQDEIRKLSESVKFGLQQSISRGVVLGSSNILGYRKRKGKLIIDKNEARIVRDIFNMFITNEYSYKKLALLMNEKYNKKFDSSSIKRILINYKYKGYYCGRKSTIIDYKSNKRNNYSRDKWIIYRDRKRVPVIVKEEIWDRANEIVNKRTNKRNKAKYRVYSINYNKKYKYVVKKYKNNIYKYYVMANCISINESIIERIASSNSNIYVEDRDWYLKILVS